MWVVGLRKLFSSTLNLWISWLIFTPIWHKILSKDCRLLWRKNFKFFYLSFICILYKYSLRPLSGTMIQSLYIYLVVPHLLLVSIWLIGWRWFMSGFFFIQISVGFLYSFWDNCSNRHYAWANVFIWFNFFIATIFYCGPIYYVAWSSFLFLVFVHFDKNSLLFWCLFHALWRNSKYIIDGN